MAGTIPSSYQNSSIARFKQQLVANSIALYTFIGRAVPFDNDSQPPVVKPSVRESWYEPYQQLLCLKRVTSNDVVPMISLYGWTSNTIYACYDDMDELLETKPFYVHSAGAVFKCLDNAGGAPSTEQPATYADVPFVTSDGYKWKYMYSIPTEQYSKFATLAYIPVLPNQNVIDAATTGIDRIVVTTGGNGYCTYTSGEIQAMVSPTVYKISANASSTADYYNGSAIFITSGSAEGELRVINDYVVNSTGKFVTVASAFSENLTTTSAYYIAPHVSITGDGTGFVGYPVINQSTNAISSIIISNPGTGYSNASAAIVANTAFGSGAQLRVILPPPGGHGSNPGVELFARHVGIGVMFMNHESNTISTDVKFRQVGLLQNPLYANGDPILSNTISTLSNAAVTYAVSNTQFTIGERITYTGDYVADVAYANATHVQLSGATGPILTGTTLVGQTSRVIASVTSINSPSMDRYSGDILYVQNLQPVQRSPFTNEAIKLVIKI